ncbi:hypothetical protein [Cysteiniphilum litorale]|uniref:hypothetical protein n=1 Tax=Cysteiniphilum litorale TaxID=2056700 RepID=UPI003F8833EE
MKKLTKKILTGLAIVSTATTAILPTSAMAVNHHEVELTLSTVVNANSRNLFGGKVIITKTQDTLSLHHNNARNIIPVMKIISEFITNNDNLDHTINIKLSNNLELKGDINPNYSIPVQLKVKDNPLSTVGENVTLGASEKYDLSTFAEISTDNLQNQSYSGTTTITITETE